MGTELTDKFWCNTNDYYVSYGQCLSRQGRAEEAEDPSQLPEEVEGCLGCGQGKINRNIINNKEDENMSAEDIIRVAVKEIITREEDPEGNMFRDYEGKWGRTDSDKVGEVFITKKENDNVLFSVPSTKESFVQRRRGGRLYAEEVYVEPKMNGVKPKVHEPKVPTKEPQYVEQKGYKGEVEMVDINKYSIPFQCDCGEVRWIKPSDAFQVSACKPCTRKRQKETLKAKRKAKANG